MRYKATTFDYLQYLYNTTGFNDHQLHSVIKFDNRLDAVILEKAVNQLVKTVPILARKYIDKEGCSYWEDSSTIRKAELFTIVSNEKEFERFICSKTNEATGPQFKVCLFRSDKDCVAIVMNHMITDGAGFKQCLYLFASIYNNLSQNTDYVPSFIVDGDRSFKNVISNIPFFKKLKTLLFGRKENNQSSSETFPMSNTVDTSPFILTYNVKPERYNQLIEFGKENNVTVNDVLLTAYIRALSKMLNINRKYLSIPIMVDMRRYLKEKSFKALTNLTSIATLRLRVYQDESFKETLYRVNSSMWMRKHHFIGLNTFLKLDVLYRLFRKNLAYKLLRCALVNPNICMTNIGVIDSAKLNFVNSNIENAYICGSIKYRPHFQLAVSTFQDKMTWCINLYGSEEDKKNINEFFALMEEEINSIQDSEY